MNGALLKTTPNEPVVEKEHSNNIREGICDHATALLCPGLSSVHRDNINYWIVYKGLTVECKGSMINI